MPELIKFSKDGRCEHIFYIDPSGPLRVQEECELLDRPNDVLLFEVLLDVFKMREGRDQLRDIFFKVAFSQVAISICVVQADVDSCLEEVVLADNRVEERLHVNSAIFVSIEFQES